MTAFEVIPRAAWGARAPARPLVPVSWLAGVTVVYHHTVTARVSADPGLPGPRWRKVLTAPARYPRAQVARVRRQWAVAKANRTRTLAAEAAAMRAIDREHRVRGWLTIGYAVACFDSGRVYEARGLGVIGAHAPGSNHLPSFAFAGDFSRRPPTQAAVKSALAFAELVRAGRLVGHGDVYATACPGSGVRSALGLPRTFTLT